MLTIQKTHNLSCHSSGPVDKHMAEVNIISTEKLQDFYYDVGEIHIFPMIMWMESQSFWEDNFFQFIQ